jgi:hypothetical protein
MTSPATAQRTSARHAVSSALVRRSPYGQGRCPLRGAGAIEESPLIRNVVPGRLRLADNPAQRAADAALLQEGLAVSPRSGCRACSL